ncbi:hypothetical protein Scep_018182 [Stephania cephalantha]|uniref:Uncharacterized protein n=1 Tax=Stephania cephalantha TaxID=152367 RepID=A0AAP0IQW6_9MAGN
MDASMNDFDRFILNEHERKLCDAAYAINPLDADNLAKWGGALLELSQFQGSPSEMTQMLKGKFPRKRKAVIKYDIFGWIILAGIVAASVGMAKSHVPSPPPR